MLFSVQVFPTLDPPGLRLRSQPNTSSTTLTMEAPGTLLAVLEEESAVALKIGVNGQWLRVRDPNGLEGYVAAWYVRAAGNTSPAATSPTTSAPVQTKPAFSIPTPQQLIDAINAERAKNKLPALKVHSALMKSAQKHADYMASSGKIVHESADGSRPFQRHLAEGFPLAGDLSRGGFASENIVAFPRMTVQEAVAYWYGDDPHTRTMLADNYTDCGAGIAVSGEMIYYCFDAARSTTTTSTSTPPVSSSSTTTTSSNSTPVPSSASTPQPAPSSEEGYFVYVPNSLTAGLRIRKEGSLSGSLIRVASPGERLEAKEPAAAAKSKIGVDGKWLKIRDKTGNIGYVAAWLLSETP